MALMNKPITKTKNPIAENRKARFDVAVDETLEAGLILDGTEIKSIRAHRAQLTGAYVRLVSGKPMLIGMHLSQAGEAERVRPLLLHKKQIKELQEAMQTRGQTVVPLKIYLAKGFAKLLIGIGTGRKLHQKRDLLRERDITREVNSELKRHGR